jgi:hypothetical protein
MIMAFRPAARVLLVLFLVSLVYLAVGGDVAAASPRRWAVCGEWRHVPVDDGRGRVTDVAVVSPTEAWAITDYGYESFNRSYVYRWKGTRWSRVGIPKPSTSDTPFWSLEALTVVSPTEVWAVGFERRYTTGFVRPITARWNGTRWRWVHVAVPNLGGTLEGAAVIPGTHQVWAVGQTGRHPHTFALRWNGSTWRHVRSPSPGTWSVFSDVTSAGGAIWAVGTVHPSGGPTRMLAAKRTGRGWIVRLGPRGVIAAVDGSSRTSLWAVGRTRVAGSPEGMIAHWNGQGWVLARRFDRVDGLTDVVTPATSDAWAVGNTFVKADQQDRPFVLHRGSGRWRIDWAPNIRGTLTAIDGTPHNLWAPRAFHEPVTAELASFNTYHRC